jgi:hypothetical protein
MGAGKLITDQLFSTTPSDRVMLTLTTLLLGMAALLALMISAWRAAGVADGGTPDRVIEDRV